MTTINDMRKLLGSEPTLFERTVKVVIPAAQVLTLRATPKVLVPSQGTNRLLQFLHGVVELRANTVQYTESADNLVVRYTDGSGVVVSQVVEMTGFLTQATRYFTTIQQAVDGIVAATGCLNKALVLHNNGDGEFANSGNGVMVIHLAYRVWDLS